MAAALAQPLMSLTRVLKNKVGIIHHVCQRQVVLSSKSVIPTTIADVRTHLLNMAGTWFNTDESTILKADDRLQLKKSQKDLPVRSMQDSYQEVIIPLGQDPSLRKRYITIMEGLRFGRILEDLDIFAVFICYIHNQDPSKDQYMNSPLSTVTALVDRIDLHDVAISPFKDVKLCGHVTWVARTLMEVTMVVEQEIDGRQKQMLTAKFFMVSLNPETKRIVAVNGLQPANDQERELFREGEQKKMMRQKEAQRSLLKTPPNEEERNVIHNLFLHTIDHESGSFRARVKPENTVWMENTRLKNLLICHPEQKNLHNKLFGGFLMRQAFELAWATAAIYSKKRPVVMIVDDIIFRKPVEIGSLLFLSSQIVYTDGPLMQIKVHAEVINLLTGSQNTTNDFYFAFNSNQPDLPRVIPRTYSDSMLFLEGMRHLKE